jgi:dihydropteroate synthase
VLAVTEPPQILAAGRFRLRLDRPLVMGIVNITPDSFSDGGQFLAHAAAIEHAHRLIEEGADILDFGAESSRPGAAPVDAAEELRRLTPVLEALAGGGVPLSVDTMKPEVMKAAIKLGAVMINDIHALQAPDAVEAVADSDAAVCLMHMQGEPRTMQSAPSYEDVSDEVGAFLAERVAACMERGIAFERIVIDPGFGFGKRIEHNLELLADLEQFTQIGVPVLVGLSRKSTLGQITGRAPEERLAASLSAALIAIERGARIVRVHDVAATKDAIAVWHAVKQHSRTHS